MVAVVEVAVVDQQQYYSMNRRTGTSNGSINGNGMSC